MIGAVSRKIADFNVRNADHSWVGYIGYAILGIGAIVAIVKEV